MSKYTRENFFSTDAKKAFIEREAYLRGCVKWPVTHWYNDEDFCELYRLALGLLDELNCPAHKYGPEAVKLLEKLILIEDLWVPNGTESVEHFDECAALCNFHQQVKSLLDKIKNEEKHLDKQP